MAPVPREGVGLLHSFGEWGINFGVLIAGNMPRPTKKAHIMLLIQSEQLAAAIPREFLPSNGR